MSKGHDILLQLGISEDDNLRMIIMSHLSDVQELISMGQLKEANERINLVKKIVFNGVKKSISKNV